VAGLSFGLGVFLGFLPIGAFATVLAAFLPRRVGLPVPPAVTGTFAGNWLTAPFIYAASFWVGNFFTAKNASRWMPPPPDSHWSAHVLAVLRMGPSFLLGIIVVSFLAGMVGYGLIRILVPVMRRLRHHVYARKIERLPPP
jgi:uncharacterized protein (DUF2062 family)